MFGGIGGLEQHPLTSGASSRVSDAKYFGGAR